jgi:hypothetical protein
MSNSSVIVRCSAGRGKKRSGRRSHVGGRWAVVLWALRGLAALGTVGVYLAVSTPSHDLTAYATALVTVVGFGRFAYRRAV